MTTDTRPALCPATPEGRGCFKHLPCAEHGIETAEQGFKTWGAAYREDTDNRLGIPLVHQTAPITNADHPAHVEAGQADPGCTFCHRVRR